MKLFKKKIKIEAENEMETLKNVLKQYHKDLISLGNLKSKYKSMIHRLKTTKEEQSKLQQTFDEELRNFQDLKDNSVIAISKAEENKASIHISKIKDLKNLENKMNEKENELETLIVDLKERT